jgi:hypothetical protein
MIVEINPDILNKPEEFLNLKYLLNLCFYKRRYDVFIDIMLAKSTTSYGKLDKDEQLLLDELFNRYIQEGLTSTLIVGSDYTLDEAIRYLNQPFLIVLENGFNDGYFVDSLLKNFRGNGKKIRKWKENGWVKYGMGGGCSNIINFIKNETQTYCNLPKDKFQYLRCFVLVDSDKKYPEDTLENKTVLIKYLKDHNIPYTILEKREIENYLPVEAFPHTTENANFIKAYNRLTPQQQDYIDIEKGFNRTKFDRLPIFIQQFYSNLSDPDKQLFRDHELVLDGNFKAEFPKLFLSEKVTRDTLMAKCSHQSNPNELPHLLEKISNLL